MIKVKALDPFKILYKLPPGTNTVVLIGGRGGAKTYEVSKYVAYNSTIHKKRCVILRDEKELIRESILNEILLRYDTANEEGALGRYYLRLDTGIKDVETNEMVVFTKGFRASKLANKANLKSISDIDIAVIEEAEDIRDVDRFNTFQDSIRKKDSIVLIILNTPDTGHWIVKRFFNLEKTEHDGYFKLVPKVLPGFVCIQTSYVDNPHLPDHVVSRYKAYGDPLRSEYNLHYFLTSIQGYASTGRKGQILTKVKPIKLEEYLALPFKEYYGQDYGTASPAGLLGVKFHKNNCYARQINYLPMDTKKIAINYCILQMNDADPIICDSAEPKTTQQLSSGWKQDQLTAEEIITYPRLMKGFNCIDAIKGSGSVKTGIGLMTSMNLFAVEESTDLWNEILNWIYAVDKNMNPTDEPVDNFNHLIDPWRYVVTYYKGEPPKKIKTAYFR